MNKTTISMIVVIGASAGGMAALKKLVAQFLPDFPASVFIVNHMSADITGEVLVKALNESGTLPCVGIERFAFGGGDWRSGAVQLSGLMSKNERKSSSSSIALRAKDFQVHIDRIRALLKATDDDLNGERAG